MLRKLLYNLRIKREKIILLTLSKIWNLISIIFKILQMKKKLTFNISSISKKFTQTKNTKIFKKTRNHKLSQAICL